MSCNVRQLTRNPSRVHHSIHEVVVDAQALLAVGNQANGLDTNLQGKRGLLSLTTHVHASTIDSRFGVGWQRDRDPERSILRSSYRSLRPGHQESPDRTEAVRGTRRFQAHGRINDATELDSTCGNCGARILPKSRNVDGELIHRIT